MGQAMQAYSVPCWWVVWWLWRAGCISQDTYLLYMDVAESLLRILCNSALLVEFMSQHRVLPCLLLDKIEACSVFPSLKSSSDAGQKCGQDVHVEVHAHFNGHASPS